MNRQFNKSFNDLYFIQNTEKKLEKYIFVFDFDLTLTNKSSNNINLSSNYIELFESEEKLEKLKEYLIKIKKLGFIIYINTIALVSDIKLILNKINISIGQDNLIKDIKGSESIEKINNPFNNEELEKYNLINITNIKILWGLKKVIMLNLIKNNENVKSENILFFDDSKVNIDIARINGYKNSFLIGSNDSGLYGLDYLIIKLDQIFDLIIN